MLSTAAIQRNKRWTMTMLIEIKSYCHWLHLGEPWKPMRSLLLHQHTATPCHFCQ
jgi:hypothetical protein